MLPVHISKIHCILFAFNLFVVTYLYCYYILSVILISFTGLGFGLIYLPAIVSVTCYFEKYRSLATGIAVCGSGLGTFVFAPIITLLLQEYGWKGSMLIIGGLLLNCIVFGVIFRPLVPKKKKHILLTPQNNESLIKTENLIKPDVCNGNETFRENNSSSTNHLNVVNNKASSKGVNGDVQKRPHSVHLFPNDIIPSSQMNGTSVITTVTNSNISTSVVISSKSSDTARLAVSQPHLDRRHWGSQVLRPAHSGVILSNKHVFYRGSLAQLPEPYR